MNLLSRDVLLTMKQLAPGCNIKIRKCNGNDYSHFDYASKTVVIYLNRKHDKNYHDRLLVHEVCHYLTWNDNWEPKLIDGNWVRGHPTMYLAEYKAEKLMRKLARKYEWWNLLEESGDMLLSRGKYREYCVPKKAQKANSFVVHLWGWPYAAKRIIREEKLLWKT